MQLNRIKKIIYLNIMFLISFFIGASISLIILTTHQSLSEAIELAIIKYVCSPMVIIPAIGWVLECIALFNIKIKSKWLNLDESKKNKND